MTVTDSGQLFDPNGRRKYVTGGEWRRFLAAAEDADLTTRTLCKLIAFTGCRLSEALGVTSERIDAEMQCVVFRTLKRRKLVYRAVPIPPALLTALASMSQGKAADERLWRWCRQTAWRRIKRVMAVAAIRGPQATAKGLRHGFGIANATENVPGALTQRWMGHAHSKTTAIYQEAVGPEERAFAERLWRRVVS